MKCNMKFSKIKKVFLHVLGNWQHLHESQVRTCKCCNKLSLIVSLSNGEEYKLCIRCRANLRYELIAEVLSDLGPEISTATIVELDPNSPLRKKLSRPMNYIRTYYSPNDTLGVVRSDGARCEDITKLTFDDESVDILISSDVLEHIPNLGKAFEESSRVLKIGGWHIFTVPTRSSTRIRANLKADGSIKHIEPPEYHSDPLNPDGILAFWDIGPDVSNKFKSLKFRIGVLKGPIGKDLRIVYGLQKL